ncbi:MAG: HAD-IA family hydrolase [Bacteriovoracaceae bacterium]|nr:HAD-IA family hydrolase [Bacteriovoracaceae bacterium]
MGKITHIVFDHDGTLVDTSGLKRYAYTGIKELLQFLKEQNIEMSVWTARSRESTKSILEDLKLLSYFSGICGGSDAASKPSAEGIEQLVFGENPKNVIVIGDSLGDIIGAKKFGATALAAMWGHQQASAAKAYAEHGADESFLSVDECKNYIAKRL